MTEYNTHKLNVFQIAFLVLIGVVASYVPLVVTGCWVAIFLITVYASLSNRQEWIWYCIAASPILEVWSRMVRGVIIVDEIGKYYLLLAIAAIATHHIKHIREKPLYKTGIILIAMLVPSLIVNLSAFDREQWVFNILPTLELSILLTLAARERWDIERFVRTIQFGAMPILFIAIYLALKTPALDTVSFALSANFKTAAGGTNQVATVLGLGILYTMLLLLLKRPVATKWLLYLLLAFLFFRSFLTFSRGGVFSAVASVLVATGFAMIVNVKTFLRYSAILILFVGLGFFIFKKVDDISGNKLSQRYRGETIATISGEQEKTWNKVTSGRTTLIAADWYTFRQYPFFGVGPGGAKPFRTEYGAPPDSAAHTEFTRLISEHGLGGMLASLVLLIFPLYWISKQRYRLWKGVSAALFCMAVLTASHSAMRTNTTIVCYTLAAIPVVIKTRKIAV